MYIWSSSKCQLVEFGDIRINHRRFRPNGYKNDVDAYDVDVYSKNVPIEYAGTRISQCVQAASFWSEAEAVDLVQDIIDAYCSGVKVYSVSDRHRYC